MVNCPICTKDNFLSIDALCLHLYLVHAPQMAVPEAQADGPNSTHDDSAEDDLVRPCRPERRRGPLEAS